VVYGRISKGFSVLEFASSRYLGGLCLRYLNLALRYWYLTIPYLRYCVTTVYYSDSVQRRPYGVRSNITPDDDGARPQGRTIQRPYRSRPTLIGPRIRRRQGSQRSLTRGKIPCRKGSTSKFQRVGRLCELPYRSRMGGARIGQGYVRKKVRSSGGLKRRRLCLFPLQQ